MVLAQRGVDRETRCHPNSGRRDPETRHGRRADLDWEMLPFGKLIKLLGRGCWLSLVSEMRIHTLVVHRIASQPYGFHVTYLRAHFQLTWRLVVIAEGMLVHRCVNVLCLGGS